jgi:uncharacterized Zn finger protein
MGWYWDYPRAKRRPANGIQAQSGKFGETWWAGRWLAALERLVDSGRLSRGRSYARSGQVLNIDISSGCVDSRVQGSYVRPYDVHIEIKPLSDEQWAKVADALASQAIFAAKLLTGEMPQDIEEAFAAAGVSLFPAKRSDLVTECSCPDWANPCKHIAAVYYLLGEQFDADPFLLFRLRGRSRDEVMAMLRERRSLPDALPIAEEASARPGVGEFDLEEEAVPPEECLDRFWDAAVGLEELQVTIEAPVVDGVPVRRLGRPGFWRNAKFDFLDVFAGLYREVTRRSLAAALGDEEK